MTIIKEDIKAIKRAKTDDEWKKQIIPKSEQKNILWRSPDFWDTIMMRKYFDFIKSISTLFSSIPIKPKIFPNPKNPIEPFGAPWKNEVSYPISSKHDTNDWIFCFGYGEEVKASLKEGIPEITDDIPWMDLLPFAKAFE